MISLSLPHLHYPHFIRFPGPTSSPSSESLSNGSLPLSAHIVPLGDNYPSPGSANDDLSRWLNSSSSSSSPSVVGGIPRTPLHSGGVDGKQSPPPHLCNGMSTPASSGHAVGSPVRNGSSSSLDGEELEGGRGSKFNYIRSSLSSLSSSPTSPQQNGTSAAANNNNNYIHPALKRSAMKEVRRPGKNFNKLFAILSDLKHPPTRRLLLVRMAQMEAVRFKRLTLVEMLQNLDDLLVEEIDKK